MFTPRADHAIRVEPFDRQTFEGFEIETAFIHFTDHLGRPAVAYAGRCLPTGDQPVPGVLHVPGGTQTVEPASLAWLARRGYAAVSFDWETLHTEKHDPKRKSRWPAGIKPQNQPIDSIEQAILPDAIGAACSSIDWLCQSPRVAGQPIGAAGISWGGYLLWAINAYEPRLRCAVPVFGCGGRFEPDRDGGAVSTVSDAVRKTWSEQWDAFGVARGQLSPVCYLSATNDFFGQYTQSQRLLDQLTVDHRHSALPNANHHLGEGEVALAEAWFAQHLRGQGAVPPAPTLNPDLTIDAPESPEWRIAARELWWTPADRPEMWRAWWPGLPRDRSRVRLAFGRVSYRNGVTLNTSMWRADPPPVRTDEPRVAELWPIARAGLSFDWYFNTTRFYGHRVRLSDLPGEPQRCVMEIERPGKRVGGPFDVSLAMTDPAWNFDASRDLVCDLEAPGGQLTLAKASLDVTTHDGNTRRLSHRSLADAVTQPAPDCSARVCLRLSDFLDAPTDFRWPLVVRVLLAGQISGNTLIAGPFRWIEK